MEKLQRLKGTYFAIKVNNNLDEIKRTLIEAVFIPNEEWNDLITENNITYVIVYEDLTFEFHNHDGNAKTIEL